MQAPLGAKQHEEPPALGVEQFERRNVEASWSSAAPGDDMAEVAKAELCSSSSSVAELPVLPQLPPFPFGDAPGTLLPLKLVDEQGGRTAVALDAGAAEGAMSSERLGAYMGSWDAASGESDGSLESLLAPAPLQQRSQQAGDAEQAALEEANRMPAVHKDEAPLTPTRPLARQDI